MRRLWRRRRRGSSCRWRTPLSGTASSSARRSPRACTQQTRTQGDRAHTCSVFPIPEQVVSDANMQWQTDGVTILFFLRPCHNLRICPKTFAFLYSSKLIHVPHRCPRFFQQLWDSRTIHSRTFGVWPFRAVAEDIHGRYGACHILFFSLGLCLCVATGKINYFHKH